MFSRVVAIVACLLAGAALAFGIIQHSAADSDRAQIRQQARQLSQTSAEVSKLSKRLGNLSTTVDGISQPSDPLSSYDQICNQDFTNSSTGNEQVYYFPCTNNAQTIPLPGG